jgi:hypothetical protein
MIMDTKAPDRQATVRDRGMPRALYRAGSAAAVGGVAAALAQTAIDPGIPDDPREAIAKAASSRLLATSRLLDMAAFLLLLLAVAIMTGTFSQQRARGWAEAGLTMFAVAAAAGATATMVVGALPDVASAWADGPAGLKAGYVAAFDALSNVSGGIFAVAWAATGMFGLLYAAAMLQERTFPRWLPWLSLCSGIATLAALAVGVGLQLDAAFMLLLAGLWLSYAVIATFGVRLWRASRPSASQPGRPAPSASPAGLPS